MAGKQTHSQLQQSLRVFFGRGIIIKICFGVIVFMILIAVFAPALTKYSPTEQALLDKLQKPSATHLLGTDHLGRDLLTRLMYGARISLITSLFSSVIAAAIGMVLGLIAGYFSGVVSQLILRITDAQLSIPPLILTMVLASLLGGGVKGVAIVIGVSMIPTYTRMLYGMVLSLRETDYVVASRLVGGKNISILFKHLLPNCFPSLIVLFTMNLGTSIMLEASMSFLGLGITPPTPTWGGMVSEGYKYLILMPSLAILPGICVILIVVAFNIVGDGLRDALDPRLRGKL